MWIESRETSVPDIEAEQGTAYGAKGGKNIDIGDAIHSRDSVDGLRDHWGAAKIYLVRSITPQTDKRCLESSGYNTIWGRDHRGGPHGEETVVEFVVQSASRFFGTGEFPSWEQLGLRLSVISELTEYMTTRRWNKIKANASGAEKPRI